MMCVVSNVGKFSGKKMGVFINDKLLMESKDGFFTFECKAGDKVTLKAAGWFGGSVIATRKMHNNMEMSEKELFFTV